MGEIKIDRVIMSHRKTIALVIMQDTTLVVRAPFFTPAHNNLGKAYQDKGLLNEAIIEYQKALSMNPDYAEAYEILQTISKRK